MKKIILSLITFLFLMGASPAFAATTKLYLSDGTDLYSTNSLTWPTVTHIGSFGNSVTIKAMVQVGSVLFGTDGDGSQIYSINRSTGAATATSSSTGVILSSPVSLAEDPTGHVLYLISGGGMAYTINAVGGASLSFTFNSGNSPVWSWTGGIYGGSTLPFTGIDSTSTTDIWSGGTTGSTTVLDSSTGITGTSAAVDSGSHFWWLASDGKKLYKLDSNILPSLVTTFNSTFSGIAWGTF